MTPELADKMAKLLRLACSTGPDGEKLAALSRLAAVALAHDVEWDEVLVNGHRSLSHEEMTRIFAAGVERGIEIGHQSARGATQKTAPDWSPVAGKKQQPRTMRWLDEVLDAAKACDLADGLNDFEERFSADMRERYLRYGFRTLVSEKQWVCLERLAEKLERRGYL